MAGQQVRFIVQVGNIPEGFCGTQQELAQIIADRLIVTPDQDYATFATGSNEPTSDVGPWLKNGTEWWVWDVTLGRYVPMTFSTITSVTAGFVRPWPSTVATIPSGWLFCNGTEYAISDYPLLYGVLGNLWGGTVGLSFKVPDMRNVFVVGANTDTAGAPTSTVSDGATPLTSRVFTPHHHQGGNVLLGGGPTVPAGAGFSLGLVDTTDDTPRAIPPFIALPFIIKT